MEFNSNAHNYEQNLLGLKKAQLITIILSVFISAALYQIIGFMAAVIFILCLVLGIVRVNSTPLILHLGLKLDQSFRSSSGFFNADFTMHTHSGCVFVEKKKILYLPIGILPENLIGLGNRDRKASYVAMKDMLDSVNCEIKLLVVPVNRDSGTEEEFRSNDYTEFEKIVFEGTTYFRPYLLLSRKINSERSSTESVLVSDFRKISGLLTTSEMKWYFPNEVETERILMYDMNSSGLDSVTHDVSYSTGRRFYQTDGNFYMALHIFDFKEGPASLLSQGIDSLDFPCFFRTDIRRYNADKGKKVLKYLLSERSTDLRIHRSRQSARNNVAERQFRELNSFMKSTEENGDRLIDAKLTLIFGSEDAMDLSRRFHRVSTMLNFLGLEFRVEEFYSRKKILNLLPTGNSGPRYLTTSSNLSQLMPIFFTAVPESGFVIGLNSATDKAETFSFFKKNSFNLMIIGETGSGKSHFSKLLLRRGFINGGVQRSLIIDPLGEYRPEFFGVSGNIINLQAGEYIDLPHGTSLESLDYLISIITSSIQFKEEDQVVLRSIVAGCLKRGVNALAEILETVSSRMKEYKDEIDYAISIHFRKSLNITETDSRATIVRLSSLEQNSRQMQLLQLATFAYVWMSMDTDEKVILMDEAHVFLDNLQVTRVLDALVRNSRHFNTSVVTVTQNFSDFQRTEYSRNILNNTLEFFVFRSKLEKTEYDSLFGEKVRDRDFIANLKGGKNDRFSECVRAGASRAYPIRIISTNKELEVLS